ncbi:MAG: trans-sulfuration enzyme family protein, partial [Halanaerobiales bacterium]
MDSNKNKFQTKAIHAGHVEKNPKNALNYPIFMTSTFSFNNLDHAEYTFTHESEDYVYTRGNNPTLRVLERNVAELEKGVDGVAFASGMAAISSTIFSFIEAGDKVIAHKVLYGSSYNLLNNILPKFNVEVELVDLTDINALKAAIDDNTKLIYFETPSNPTLEIIDIKKVAEVAESEDVKVAVDNTFAT